MITCWFMNRGGLILIVALAIAAMPDAQAEQKKDASDPVLQEVIASFESRMPRFIKKHGNDVFVAESPINRGSLLLALYEYDHSLKIPQKNYVTRQEFDEMKSRLALLEKTPATAPAKADKKAVVDIVSLLNELQPNMPVLLDNTLNESKVFTELRDKIKNRTDFVAPASFPAADRRDATILLQRIERLEQAQANITKKTPATEVTLKDINRLENRIEDLSFITDGTQSSSGHSSSFLTKVSVGIGMVAAFMVAR